jgi:hypothetical protein
MIIKGAAPRARSWDKRPRWSATLKAEPVVVGATDRSLDRNTGTGPAVMILAGNIVELELDFHGDGLAGPHQGTGPLSQHFLLSANARSLSLASIMRMTDDEARNTFKRVRWSANDDEPFCPHCGCLTV